MVAPSILMYGSLGVPPISKYPPLIPATALCSLHSVTVLLKVGGSLDVLKPIPNVLDPSSLTSNTWILLAAEPNKPKVDRKSTRLNSSHVKISYAVFCLKKKKKIQNSVLERHTRR